MPNDSSIFGSFSTRNFTGSILSSSANSFMADSVANELADELKMDRSEEHTSELQSQSNLVCRLLLEKKKKENGIIKSRTETDSTTTSSSVPTTICPYIASSRTKFPCTASLWIATSNSSNSCACTML